ncbi:MAG: hypothetical protein ACI9J3_003502 [Parvicellaceae bacterium]|jgi:hypothetical protein
MNKVVFLIILTFLNGHLFGQFCTSVGPSSNIDSNVESVGLTGEGGANISYVGCPGVIGLQDLTANSATLNSGGNYTLNVQFGTCGNNYNGAGEAWIDYNFDQVFDPSESLGTWTGIPPVSMSNFNFTVPAGAFNGTTRMRIIQQENGSIPLDPCATFSWGSTMDFTIEIQNGVDCSSYFGDDASDAIEVSALPYTDVHSTAICYTSVSTVYPSPDVFYRVILDGTVDQLTVSSCGSLFDTYLTIYNGALTPIFFSDDAVSCAPQSEVTFSTFGLDTVFVSIEGWNLDKGDYTLNVYQSTVSVNENSASQFQIYPNPAMNIIRIDGLTNGTVGLYNQQGKMLMKESYNGELDISRFSAGIYYLEIKSEGDQIHKKLVIE